MKYKGKYSLRQILSEDAYDVPSGLDISGSRTTLEGWTEAKWKKIHGSGYATDIWEYVIAEMAAPSDHPTYTVGTNDFSLGGKAQKKIKDVDSEDVYEGGLQGLVQKMKAELSLPVAGTKSIIPTGNTAHTDILVQDAEGNLIAEYHAKWNEADSSRFVGLSGGARSHMNDYLEDAELERFTTALDGFASKVQSEVMKKRADPGSTHSTSKAVEARTEEIKANYPEWKPRGNFKGKESFDKEKATALAEINTTYFYNTQDKVTSEILARLNGESEDPDAADVDGRQLMKDYFEERFQAPGWIVKGSHLKGQDISVSLVAMPAPQDMGKLINAIRFVKKTPKQIDFVLGDKVLAYFEVRSREADSPAGRALQFRDVLGFMKAAKLVGQAEGQISGSDIDIELGDLKALFIQGLENPMAGMDADQRVAKIYKLSVQMRDDEEISDDAFDLINGWIETFDDRISRNFEKEERHQWERKNLKNLSRLFEWAIK